MGTEKWRGYGIAVTAILSSLIVGACGSGRGVDATSQLGGGGNQTDSQPKALKRAASSAEFEAYLRASLTKVSQLDVRGGAFDGLGRAVSPVATETALPSAPTATADAAGGGTVTPVSSTNVVENGVDETDTVKTDGNYLYVLETTRQIYYGLPQPAITPAIAATGDVVPGPAPVQLTHKIRILQRDKASPGVTERAVQELDAKITSVDGFFLVDRTPNTPGSDTLFVIGRGNNSFLDANTGAKIYMPHNYVVAFDVSTPDKPKTLWNFAIEGYLTASRSAHGRIYLVTQKYVWPQNLIMGATTPEAVASNQKVIADFNVDTLLPAAQIDGTAFALVSPSDCVIPSTSGTDTVFSGHLMTLVALPFDDPHKASALCTTESSSAIYSSLNSLYVTTGEYIVPTAGINVRAELNTIIHRFDYTNSGISYGASGRVPGWVGWISGAFRLNENNGYLRIVTTQWDATLRHQLNILHSAASNPGVLSVVATLPNSAHPEPIGKPGEDVHAVRFSGQHAYLVTFRRTDPLYAINLVKADDPFIEGELVIPGFSDYLHPLGENYLLGVGQDAAVVNGRTHILGVKVGLFDISDKKNLKVVNEVTIGKGGSEAWVTRDYKSIAVIDDVANGKYRVMLPVNVHEYPYSTTTPPDPLAWYDWSYSGAHLFEIANNSVTPPLLRQTGVLKAVERSNTTLYDYNYDARAIIVGDQVHYLQNAKVWSADWATPDKAVGPQ